MKTKEKFFLPILVAAVSIILVTSGAADLTFHPPDKRLDTNPPGASSSGGTNICADDNGWIYVAWDDGRNYASCHDIYFNRSSNYGATWLDNDIRVDTDLPGAADSYWIRTIACDDNGHVYVVWIDERSGRASYPQDVFFNTSANHGQTWENDKRLNRINQGSSPRGFEPRLACTQSGHVYVTWYDLRWGVAYSRNRIYFNYSHDYGNTWLENDIHIDNLSEGPGDDFGCWYPDIACDENGHTYIVWGTSNRQPRIGFRRSNDYGVTWQACQKIDNYMGTDKSASYPCVACDESGHVYVMWEDYRHDNNNLGYTDIYFNYSHDYGATWGTDIRLTTGKAPGSSPSRDDYGCKWMDCDDNGHVYVVWGDRRNGNADIYLNYSSDYGVTWQTPDIRLDTGTSAGYYTSWHPTLACDRFNNVFVVWEDARNGRRDIYMNYSTNYGLSWQASDIRVDTDNAGYGESAWPMIATENGLPFIVWDDLRNCSPPGPPSENADIYFQSPTLVAGSTFNLVAGWNLVCFTGAGESDTPSHIFTGLTYYTDYFIYWWEAPGGPYHLQGQDEVLKDNLGYWVWAREDNYSYTTTGVEPASRDIHLIPGWNLVGFPITNEGTTPRNIFTGLTYFTDYYIYHWSAPGGPYVLMGPDEVFENYLGYWTWINQDKTVTVP